jgi:quinol monooxygenase YgiN
MGGRRRRDDGWDESRDVRPEGWRNPWPDDGRGGWSEPGRGDGRHRAALPAAGQGAYQPQSGYQQPGYAETGYQGTGYAETGYQGTGYAETGYQGTGYAETGYQGAGYAETGYQGAGHPSAGAAGAGFASGAGDPRYSDQAGTAYGYAGGAYPDPGHAGAGRSSGYADPGYGQPAPGGSGFAGGAARDANANGNASGSYPAGRTAGWGSDREFPESPATAQYGRSSSWGPDLANGEYRSSSQAGPANGAPPGTPRPYGRLSIFTLLEDKAAEFDRLAEQAAEGVRAAEPDTLVYVFHVVPNAPMQRIIYEIYRDREAFESHERQPHIQRFVADRKACVLATNIIDLRLKYAKVAALASSPSPAAPAAAPSASAQETRVNPAPRALEPGWPAETPGRYAGPGYGRSAGSDDRVPRSRFVAWDQPAYQGQRPGGN